MKGRDLPRMYGPHWEIVGLVSRRLIVRPSCAPVIDIAHAPVPVGCPHVRYTASASRARSLANLQYLTSLTFVRLLNTRDHGKSFSWNTEGWASLAN